MKEVFVRKCMGGIIIAVGALLSVIFLACCNRVEIALCMGVPIIIAYIYVMVAFSQYINCSKVTISDLDFFNIKNVEKVCFICHLEDGVYIIQFGNKEISFYTDNELFSEKILISFLIRNIRFLEISDKRPFFHLFKYRLQLKNISVKEAWITFEDKKITLVKGGVSYDRMPIINKAPYYMLFLNTRIDTRLMKKMKINEKIYQERDLGSRRP